MSHIVTLTHQPTTGTTAGRTNDLSPLIAVHLVDVPGRLIPCRVIDSLLIHHKNDLSDYTLPDENTYTTSTTRPTRGLDLWSVWPLGPIRSLQRPTVPSSPSPCGTVHFQVKPVTAYSTEQSSYYPQHHSQGKKKPPRTPYKLAYTQKPGKSKEKKPHRSGRETPLQEGEVYLTTSDLSHEEWISQVKFALNIAEP